MWPENAGRPPDGVSGGRSRSPLCLVHAARTGAAWRRSLLVLVTVVGLDVAAVVPAALGADGVEDDAEVLGLEGLELVAHPHEQSAAVAAGADHGDHAVHPGG